MLFVILCAWLSQAAPAAQQPPELLLLSRWVRSVERHEPARADVEAATIAVWSRDDLRTTVDTLQSLRDALQRAARADGAHNDRQDIRTRSGYRLSARQAQTLLGLSDDEAQRGDVNRLLERGAMLHADIAMAAQEGLIKATEPTVPGTLPGGGPIQVSDGKARGPDEADRHWAAARALLEVVAPEPARDEWVHRWYRAAAARMRRDSLLASSEPLLARARQLFPKDAVFPFYDGCLHESYASPAIQAVYAAACFILVATQQGRPVGVWPPLEPGGRSVPRSPGIAARVAGGTGEAGEGARPARPAQGGGRDAAPRTGRERTTCRSSTGAACFSAPRRRRSAETPKPEPLTSVRGSCGRAHRPRASHSANSLAGLATARGRSPSFARC